KSFDRIWKITFKDGKAKLTRSFAGIGTDSSSLLVSACGKRECNQQNFAQKISARLADKDMELMTAPCDDIDQVLGQYRAFLETLKVTYINPKLHRYFDMSDIVQVTWWKASRDLERIEGLDEKGRKRWLFTMFRNNLRDEIRKIPPVTVVSLDKLRGAD